MRYSESDGAFGQSLAQWDSLYMAQTCLYEQVFGNMHDPLFHETHMCCSGSSRLGAGRGALGGYSLGHSWFIEICQCTLAACMVCCLEYCTEQT